MDNLKVFLDIPDKEAKREGWQEHFTPLAQKAAETSWGMIDRERWTLGVLKMLAEAQVLISLDTDFQQANFDLLGKQGELLHEVEAAEGQVATLRMQLGRAKKKIVALQRDADAPAA